MNPFLKGVENQSERLHLEETIDNHDQNDSTPHDVMATILCGSIAGAVAKTAVAPAERVKMTFQISSDKFSLGRALKHGIEIFQKGGIFSLWRGHSTTIIRVAPYSGISYASHDYAEYQFKKHLQCEQLPFVYKFLAGSIGGVMGTFFTYPLDVLRVRLALIPGSNWVSAFQRGGLFQGLSPTMMGIVPYAGTAWMVKQTLLENFPIICHRQPTLIESLILNAAAG
jgi:solute carrier family 25, member 42